MFSVGETLQRARLAQGLDVATVSARTKINAKYLEAIEADDRVSLPSSFFYKSFVHQYARTLSLDTREIDAEIDRVLSADTPLLLPGQDNPTSKEVPPAVLSWRFEKKRMYVSSAGLILMLAACSGIYGWWYQGRSAAWSKIEPGAPVAPVGQAGAVPVPVPSPRPALVAPAQLATAESKVLLDLMAREATWLSVSSDGKPVFSGILAANQSKTVEGKEYARMRVGNAAGLVVRLNGKLLGPLGHRGQVLIVVFTPDNFQILLPAKESD
jgi:transcriptional regulator with XRE-family HTH domain